MLKDTSATLDFTGAQLMKRIIEIVTDVAFISDIYKRKWLPAEMLLPRAQ